jgi:hypothetical protein
LTFTRIRGASDVLAKKTPSWAGCHFQTLQNINNGPLDLAPEPGRSATDMERKFNLVLRCQINETMVDRKRAAAQTGKPS